MLKRVLLFCCLFLLLIVNVHLMIAEKKQYKRLDEKLSRIQQIEEQLWANQQLIKTKLSSNNNIYSIQGVKYYLPQIMTDFIQMRIGWNRDFYETKELHEIDSYLPENGVFLDVGANIGNHTMFWLLKSKKTPKRIYSFEVVKKTFDILQKNIEINNLKNKAIIFNIGLSDKNINADYADFNPDACNLTSIKQSSTGGMMLKRYDDMGIKDKIDFVKIDTEGHTYEVLKGMEEMLKRDKPMIWSEVWGEKIVTENGIIIDKKRGRESQKKIFDFLHSLGYKQMLDMGRENFVFINKNE